MAKTIMDLFKERKTEVYSSPGPLGGISGLVLIESRGIINPPRQSALLLASPNAVADLIGSAGGALLGGNANRPSDTIFKNTNFITKPISVVPTVAQLRNAVEPNTTYFVKTEPSPGANIANFIKNAVQSPAAAQTAALQIVNQIGGKNAKQNFLKYVQKIKGIRDGGSNGTHYGTGFSIGGDGKPRTPVIGERRFTQYAPVYEQKPDIAGVPSYVIKGTEERTEKLKYKKDGGSPWDIVNKQILEAASKTTDSEYQRALSKLDDDNAQLGQAYVKFSIYGKPSAKNIILPGTISGISEDFAPEWNSFKYVGSPFNLYRYGGVERTLKFDVKMYYLDQITKESMINNLNRLRQLVFPDEDISVVTYPGDKKPVSQLFFTPNLVYLTLGSLYKDVLGIVDSLSFSIDDNTSWAISNADMFNDTNEQPYPTVINVAIGMKIIEHPAIKDNKFVYGESKEGANQYTNYFTDNSLPADTKKLLKALTTYFAKA
jgi:hypothetical protein